MFRDQYGETPFKSTINDYASWVNQKIDAAQSSSYILEGPDVLEYYHQNIETNEYYQILLQDKINTALNLFVAK